MLDRIPMPGSRRLCLLRMALNGPNLLVPAASRPDDDFKAADEPPIEIIIQAISERSESINAIAAQPEASPDEPEEAPPKVETRLLRSDVRGKYSVEHQLHSLACRGSEHIPWSHSFMMAFFLCRDMPSSGTVISKRRRCCSNNFL
eukprot:s271_g15.t1